MIRYENLLKQYGEITAVNNISLEISDGEMVGVIGRSGAGKSTLLRLTNRLTDPTSGRIIYNGTDVTALKGKELRTWRAKCSMIFQQFNLSGRLDVLTNTLLGRLSYHTTFPTLIKRFTTDEKAMAIDALDKLDMAHAALQRADTLSGGQQQRVAIARALMQEPEFILADEPVASLDPYNARKVMDGLKKINDENGITVLCNLHHIDTAKMYCTRVVGIHEGEVVFDGSPEGLTPEILKDIYGDLSDSEEFRMAIDQVDMEAEEEYEKVCV